MDDKQAYIDYLKSEEWREKRKEFLEDDNYECEECGEKATEIHHLNYACLGEEERDDIEVLCHRCHRELHEDKDGYGEYGEYNEYGEW